MQDKSGRVSLTKIRPLGYPLALNISEELLELYDVQVKIKKSGRKKYTVGNLLNELMHDLMISDSIAIPVYCNRKAYYSVSNKIHGYGISILHNGYKLDVSVGYDGDKIVTKYCFEQTEKNRFMNAFSSFEHLLNHKKYEEMIVLDLQGRKKLYYDEALYEKWQLTRSLMYVMKHVDERVVICDTPMEYMHYILEGTTWDVKIGSNQLSGWMQLINSTSDPSQEDKPVIIMFDSVPCSEAHPLDEDIQLWNNYYSFKAKQIAEPGCYFNGTNSNMKIFERRKGGLCKVVTQHDFSAYDTANLMEVKTLNG